MFNIWNLLKTKNKAEKLPEPIETPQEEKRGLPTSVIIFPDTLEIFVTGNPNPEKLAECLYLFSCGDMSDILSHALEVNGCSANSEWKEKYYKQIQTYLKHDKEMAKKPVVSALQAFR